MPRVKTKTSVPRRRIGSKSDTSPVPDLGPHYAKELNSYRDEFASWAHMMCADGKTDYEMSQIFGVRPQVIQHWIMLHPEFKRAYRLGSNIADTRVERTLYARAVGYHYDTWTENAKGEQIKKTFYRHPDQRAAEFWLINRVPDRWRMKSDPADSSPTQLVLNLDPKKLKGLDIQDINVLRAALLQLAEHEARPVIASATRDRDATDLELEETDDKKIMTFLES